jgi:hypothetical protein
MAPIVPIGEPANDAEREAIAYLRNNLPAEYPVLHNFELRSTDGQWFEIDIAIVAPHAVYLVDVKSTYGDIHVVAGKWHPGGRAPFASPIPKLRHHTRLLHGMLSAAANGPHAALRNVWVGRSPGPPGDGRRGRRGTDRLSRVSVEREAGKGGWMLEAGCQIPGKRVE